MQIKKHKNKNNYLLASDNLWVRDFTKPAVKPFDINDIASLEDIKLLLRNEELNSYKIYQKIYTENFVHEKIAIVSDGYLYNSSIIDRLPSDVTIIGVNGTFANWKSEKKMNYFLVNNPYNECVYYYPSLISSWPKCIASVRTNPVFVSNYQYLVYMYYPTPNLIYGNNAEDCTYYIDDYRNSICAAIGISYRFKVKKLLLLSVLDLYDTERAGTEKVGDYWIYPQQRVAHSLIDANLYWLNKANVDIRYHDVGLDYNSATYICEEDIEDFFNG